MNTYRWHGKGFTHFLTLAKWLENREPFEGGAFSGRRNSPYSSQLPLAVNEGILPADWLRTLEARKHVIDYVIFSYQTPIAWHDTEAGWIIPAVKYSNTTGRHQGAVRVAVTSLKEEYQE